jgi:hypothetical protein
MPDVFGEWSDFGAWSALNDRDTIDLSDREIYEQLETLMIEKFSEDEIGKPIGEAASDVRKQFLREAWEHYSLEIALERIWGSNRNRPDLEYQVVKGGADDGIDSYVFDDGQSSHFYGLTIIQSKWYDLNEEYAMKKANPEQLNKLAADGIKILGDLAAQAMNEYWIDVKEGYEQRLGTFGDYPIRLLFIGGKSPTDQNVLDQIDDNNTRIISYETLGKHIAAPAVHAIPQGTGTLNGSFSTKEGSKATIGSATAFELCEFFKNDALGEGVRKADLRKLEYNVRLRLTSGKQKNKRAAHVLDQTKKTIKNATQDFVNRNNGMLITVFDIDRSLDGEQLSDEEGHKRFSDMVNLETPQIVNGGQTINALFDLYKEGTQDNDDILRLVEVPVKISKVENEEEMLEIAYASNNQNPVNDRDLKSRDSRMIEMQKISGNINENVFGNPVWFDIREGELDYKEEAEGAGAITQYGQNPQRVLGNEASGKIAWSLLGGGFKAKQDSEILWTDLFNFLYHPGVDLTDFPATKVSLTTDKFFDNRTTKHMLREYTWGYLVWNMQNAISSLSKGKLNKLSEDTGTQDAFKQRLEIIPYISTIVLTIFNSILRTKSLGVFEEKEQIIGKLFGNFSERPNGGGVNAALKRPFYKQQTIKSWFKNGPENAWNILDTNEPFNPDKPDAVGLNNVIKWLGKINDYAGKVYRSSAAPPTTFRGTKMTYYTNGEGQGTFIEAVWNEILDNMAEFSLPEDDVEEEDEAAGNGDETDEWAKPNWFAPLLQAISLGGADKLGKIIEVFEVETHWEMIPEEPRNELLKWFIVNTELQQPDWMQ